jgi:hypothetical protein
MPPDQNVIRELVLAELRCASMRAKSAELEIGFIGQALKAGAISARDALLALDDQGWSGFLDPLILSKIRAVCVDG